MQSRVHARLDPGLDPLNLPQRSPTAVACARKLRCGRCDSGAGECARDVMSSGLDAIESACKIRPRSGPIEFATAITDSSCVRAETAMWTMRLGSERVRTRRDQQRPD